MFKWMSGTLVIGSLLLVGCTHNSNSSPGGGTDIGSIFDPNPIAVNPKATEKQIEDIKLKINSDPLYALHSEDLSFLKEQGLVNDDAELKGWVK
jgi:hypothetical protein